jgi:hypothetical protein
MHPIVLMLSALLGQPAQDKPQSATKTTFTLSTDDSFRFESDLDGTDASVSVAQYKVSLELFRMAGAADFFRLSAAGEALEYDFTDLKTVIPGAPEEFAEEIDAYRIDPSYVHAFDAAWSGVLYGTIAWAFEEEGNMADSAAGALGTGAFYRSGPDLTAGLTLHVQLRIDDHPWIYPLPYLEWKISPDALLKTEQKAGYGLTFDYTLDEAKTLTFEARARYQARRIRLRRDNVIPQGILDDQRGMMDVGIRWQPLANLRVTLYAGMDFWQEFTFEDRTGNTLVELESESPAFVGLAAGWEF